MGTPTDIDTQRRLSTVADLRLLARIGDPVLPGRTRLARTITGASGAAVHIFDAHYQRRIAAAGVPLLDHPEGDSMCRIAVLSGTRVITRDATDDSRFAYSSFVQAATPVRFYASL